MGLDMYLNSKLYIGAYYDHNNISGTINIIKNNKELEIDMNEISEIVFRVGYWRKANHIHAWFVANVQDATDDCKEYYVSEDDLERLKSICEEVLLHKTEAKSEELLPTQIGFFFGSESYDEWYYQDIEDTIDILNKAISRTKQGHSIYYQSSW